MYNIFLPAELAWTHEAMRLQEGRKMRFTLDGERFDLTAKQVRARIAGRLPGDIQEYWGRDRR